MKVWKMVWILLTTGVLFRAQAQEFKRVDNPGLVYEKLRDASGRVKSIRADFTEERFVSYLKEPQKSSGIFYYSQKDKMRWEQLDPVSYVILVNGSTLRISEGGKEKSTKGAAGMTRKIRDMMLNMVNGELQSDPGFEKEYLQNAGYYLIVMTPVDRRMRGLYDKIHLKFSKKSLTLKELTFFEKGGDKQVMNFLNEEINSVMDDGLFNRL